MKFLRIFIQIQLIWATTVFLYCLFYQYQDIYSATNVKVEIAKTSDRNTEKEGNVKDTYNGLWIVNSSRSSFTWPDPALDSNLSTKPDISISRQLLKTIKSLEREKTTRISPIPTALQVAGKVKDSSSTIVVLVLACNRVRTVRRCLDTLLKYRKSPDRFPIVVSLSCAHDATAATLSTYSSRIRFIQQSNQSEIKLHYAERYHAKYYYIARHYHWALNHIFFKFNFKAAIVLEDDIEVASDFFEYLSGTLPILRSDPTLWCVSAWNDNGKAFLVDQSHAELLYRTDFFPGLAWMLTREVWMELEPKWPPAFWEDWMREPAQRQGRACIRPELPRARIFHKQDKNNRSFYNKHLKFIKLYDKFVPFTNKNLSYLLKDNYDMEFVRRAYDSPVLSYRKLVYSRNFKQGRIRYNTKNDFSEIAKALGLMKDFRSGVPRTAYRGIVTFVFKGQRIYLTPRNWTSYDISWI